MDLREAIYTRRSVRAYADRPVDEKTLRTLIDAAVQAPSAINEQPWAFTVVRDRALLDRISRAAKAFMLASLDPETGPRHFRELLGDPQFDIFYRAPALVVVSAVKSQWAVEDCALAAATLMLAARAAGLGTCWIGFAQGWLGTPDGKAALDLPAAHLPVAPIIVGHPASEPPAVPRREPNIRWIGA
jgi:nitroreductase